MKAAKSFADVPKLAGQLGVIKIAGRSLRQIGAVKLVAPQDVRDLVANRERTKTQLRSNTEELGKYLGDPEMVANQLDEIIAEEVGMVEAIRSYAVDGATSVGRDQQEFTIALIKGMVDNYPSNSLALNRIADIGLRLGFWQEAPEQARPGTFVALPVSVVEGTRTRWERKKLTTNFPGSAGILPVVIKKATEVDSAKANQEDAEIALLYDGVSGDFVEVLEAGSGEAVFFAYPTNHNGRPVAGGHVRISVGAGKITPVAAVGKCAWRVKQAIEKGISIPVGALDTERLELGRRLEPDDFTLALIFHSLCRRGREVAEHDHARKAEQESLKAGASMTIEDFVGSDTAGTAYNFIREWREVRDKNAKVHKRIGVLVERNEDGEVRVSSCSEEHEELFANCREFAPSERVKYPLKQLLESAHRRAERGNGHGTTEARPSN